MTLKEKIEADFKTAFKEKDEIRKTALRGLNNYPFIVKYTLFIGKASL